MRTLPAAILILLLSLTALCASVAANQSTVVPAAAYRVIVHPQNPLASVDRQFLEDAFLRKITRWRDNTVIRPVDLRSSSAVRRRFSREVLERSIAAVKAYWQQRIFSGRGVPPPEFETEEQVVAYVLKHDGAVGYVSGSAELKGAKSVAIER
jgi:ABC-type phosphate transport system substrate-binding protein